LILICSEKRKEGKSLMRRIEKREIEVT